MSLLLVWLFLLGLFLLLFELGRLELELQPLELCKKQQLQPLFVAQPQAWLKFLLELLPNSQPLLYFEHQFALETQHLIELALLEMLYQQQLVGQQTLRLSFHAPSMVFICVSSTPDGIPSSGFILAEDSKERLPALRLAVI